jgi:POT family proton-dependent oligopeptide transporter
MAASIELTAETPPAPHSGPRPAVGVVAHILGYEAAERFAFYAFLTVLVTMTTAIAPAAGEAEMYRYLGWLTGAIFVLSLIGAIIADSLLGKFRTLIFGSLIALAGYGTIALAPAQWTVVALGLGLVAVGTGALKPCVAAQLGDQFRDDSQHLLPRTFGWFYFAIHAGALLAAGLSQYFVADPQNGVRGALVLPFVALAAGTLLLWSGRKRFLRVPATRGQFTTELFSREAGAAIVRLLGIYLFVALFWAVWQQGAAGAWPRQAALMDLRLFNLELQPEQVATANILFILLFVPLLSYLVYPRVGRLITVTPLRKIGAGLALAGLSFGVAAAIQSAIDGGGTPAVGWQLLAWALLTLGEVMIIVTALELSYTWAPRKIKSLIMAVWLLTFAARTISANGPDGSSKMSDFHHYIFFAVLMLVATAIFAVVARFYRNKTYLQSQDEPMDEVEAVAPTLGGGAPT